MSVGAWNPSSYGDQWAGEYDARFARLSDTELAVETIAELARGGPVLELGVGTGRLAIPLAGLGHSVTGLDASEKMLDVCRSKPGAHDLELDVSAGRATPTGPHGREWAGFFADGATLMDSAWAAWRRAGFTDTSMLLLARHPELRDRPSRDVNEMARRRAAVEPTFERIAAASVDFFGPGARFSPTGPGS